MRIIAGKLKGSVLHLPKNKNTRPLKDLVRESIFNLLIHSKKTVFQIENSNVLDLYAGSGSFGLECLSRLAKNVCFVEMEKNTVEVLQKNIEKLKTKNKARIFPYEVFNWIKNQSQHETNFDLIFCDPPFKNKNIKTLIELIYDKNLLKKNGVIIIHRNKTTNEKIPNYFKMLDERIYGISKIIFGKF